MWLVKRNSAARGVRTEELKEATLSLPIRRLPFPPEMVIPLIQHLGVPATPVVREGQEVVRGEPLAEAGGFFSVPMHAPATGVVRKFGLAPRADGRMTPAIFLKVHPSATQEVLYGAPLTVALMQPEDLVQAVQNTGVVGLGGAAFPTHIKMVVPDTKRVDTVIANGCECEPYLTTDYRMMVERADLVYTGLRVALRATGAKHAIVAVDEDKEEAITALRKALPQDMPVSIRTLPVKYPHGAEQMLIKSLLGLEVPSGGLPLDIGCAVFNIAALAQVGELLPSQRGLIERVITVTGPGVKRPGNYIVAIGTPLRFVLEQVGLVGDAHRIIFGGPMMGMSVSSMDIPITKGVSGIVVLEEKAADREEQKMFPCIRCGRCVEACPIHLNPCQLMRMARKGAHVKMVSNLHLMDCVECGCCSYVCPSNIPIAHELRMAKAAIQQEQALT